MRERVAALLAHASARQALEEPDLVEVLGDVVPMSEDYIPVLQFLMRPDNRKSRSRSPFAVGAALKASNVLLCCCASDRARLMSSPRARDWKLCC